MTETRRRLPHIYPDAKRLFITWSLFGALPPSQLIPPAKFSAGQAFVWIDRRLDSRRTGPLYLRQPAVAELVVNSIYKGVELGHYDLHAYVVMANHVHLLIEPKVHASLLLKSLKGATAREANKTLGRTGIPFWQRESYDHWVRNDLEFGKIRAYIENNPVRAGLVARAEDFPWSSAGVARSRDAARTIACATSTPALLIAL